MSTLGIATDCSGFLPLFAWSIYHMLPYNSLVIINNASLSIFNIWVKPWSCNQSLSRLWGMLSGPSLLTTAHWCELWWAVTMCFGSVLDCDCDSTCETEQENSVTTADYNFLLVCRAIAALSSQCVWANFYPNKGDKREHYRGSENAHKGCVGSIINSVYCQEFLEALHCWLTSLLV